MKMLLMCVAVLSVLLAGCGSESTDPAPTDPTTSKPSTGKMMEEGGNAAITAQLAAADAVDGTTDKVVTKCAGCALGMNGKADHALDVEGYSLHFCSGKCKDGFASDANAKILAMNIPGK